MTDPRTRQVVYKLPNMEQAEVRRDIPYKTTDIGDLKLDVYYPVDFNSDSPRPAVLFLHGDGPAEMLKDIKDSGQYTGWGQLTAASGLIAVTSNHRATEGLTQLENVGSDIDDLIRYVRDNAGKLGIDGERLAVCVFSAGGPTGLSAVLRDGTPDFIKCIGAVYTYMDLQSFSEHLPHLSAEQVRNFSPLYHLEQNPSAIAPMLIARAGQDRPDLNNTIDAFVAAALSHNVNFEILNHPEGQHAFDVLDDVPRSHEIISRILNFFQTHVGGHTRT